MIRPRMALPIRLTAAHPVWTPHGWKRADTIDTTDRVLLPRLGIEPSAIDEAEARFMGRFVADGCATFERKRAAGRCYLSFGHHEDVRPWQEFAASLGYTLVSELRTTRRLQFGSTTLARRYRDAFGHRATGKRIPTEIMLAPEAIVRAFLEGYLSGDGHRTSRLQVAGTVSPGLARQLQLLMAKVGRVPSLREDRPAGLHHIEGRRVSTAPRYRLEQALGDRRHAAAAEAEEGWWLGVGDVRREHYAGPVYDLTAGGSFLASNVAISNCGWTKGKDPWRAAINEMGGSLRLDRYNCAGSSPLAPFGTSFIPSLEWGAKSWVRDLERWYDGGFPYLATTVRSASPGKTKDGQALRDRLGGHRGKIIVHGLVKDDVLDDSWDDRKRLFRWLLTQDVEIICTPQFSYYDDFQNCMAVYNTNRIFRWYVECREAGFRSVALDWPPANMPWLREEYLNFAQRNDVKILAPSFQTIKERGGLRATFIADLRKLESELAPDVSMLLFGIGNVAGFAQAASTLKSRNLAFVSSEPFARAAFFRLMSDDLAPKKFSKGDTFAYNVLQMKKLTDKVTGSVQRREERRAAARARADAA